MFKLIILVSILGIVLTFFAVRDFIKDLKKDGNFEEIIEKIKNER